MIFIVSIGRAKDIENSLIDEYFIGNDFYKGKNININKNKYSTILN